MMKSETGRQTQGRQQAGSRISTMGMVQTAIFGAIVCIMAFTPLSRIYSARIYPCNDHPRSGDHRFTADGAEKGRSPRIPLRTYELYQ